MAAPLILWGLGALFGGILIAGADKEEEGAPAPAPPEPPDEPDALTKAVATADPGELMAQAQKAAANGAPQAAAVLTEMATEAKAGTMKPIEMPRPAPTPAGAPAPLTDAQITAQAFAGAAVALNSHLKKTPKGKEDTRAVAEYQEGKGGLTVDGLYGPKTAKSLGEYIFPPADPKYWPKVGTDRAKLQYLAWLKDGYAKRGKTFPDLASMAQAKKETAPVVAPTVPRVIKSPGLPPVIAPAPEQAPLPAGVIAAVQKAAEPIAAAVLKTGAAAPPPVVAIPVALAPPPVVAMPLPGLALATELAKALEGVAKWAEDQALVKRFQKAESLVQDGLYGPKSAKALGRYVFPPPAPLYWPKADTAAAKEAFARWLVSAAPVVAGWDDEEIGRLFGKKARRRRQRRRKRRRARRKKRRTRRRAFFKRAFKKIGNGLKKIARSKLVKGIAGAVAIVYPPVGVPLTAGLAAADRAIAVAEKGAKAAKAVKRGIRSVSGGRRARRDLHRGRAAVRAIATTAKAARRGDTEARRGLQLLGIAKRRRRVLKGLALARAAGWRG